MRIDPSQLSEPLAHVLGSGRIDAVAGEATTTSARKLQPEAQFEQLDKLLLKRMRATSMADSATAVTSAADAQTRIDLLGQLMGNDPAAAKDATGDLDRSRLRGLLGDN